MSCHIKCIYISSVMVIFSEVSMVQPILDHSDKVYNPYPSLGAPEKTCWPRGFPIDLVQKSWILGMTKELPCNSHGNGKIGVLQSLADFQPDVDALFRLTQKTPFVFQRPAIRKLNGKFFCLHYERKQIFLFIAK